VTISGRTAIAAFGRQTAGEGTALTTPKYEIPVGDGSGIQPRREIEELPYSNESQDPTGHYVRQVAGDFSMNFPVLPISSVALIQSFMGATATSGSGPYDHDSTFTNTLPFYTWWSMLEGQYLKLSDAKTYQASLSGSPGSPLSLDVSGGGKTCTRAAVKWGSATLAETVTPFFTQINATFKLEAASSPASTTVGNIAGWNLDVNRNVEEIQTDSGGIDYMVEGKRETSLTCDDVVLEDWDFLNTVFTGTSSGTSLSTQPIYGSAEFTFRGSDEAAALTRRLVITVPNVHWNIAQHPASNAGGGAVRYTLEGGVVKPTSGATLTIGVRNADAGSNY
jgi:hypothetical protein